ncbi:MAG: long-chain N-acyl amino acid synthase [Sulfuricella sp.]|nr:long-chain N-acyl amino acid synthase [Sulfuricella sp.]
MTKMAKIRDQNDDWAGKTIIGVPFDAPRSPRSLCLDQPDVPGVHDFAIERNIFKIRLADVRNKRNPASMLINKMYSWRGYDASAATSPHPNRITLTASHSDQVVGTISMGFDSPIGLLVDELYKAEIDPLRKEGHKLCEFTKLAVDSSVRSKRVLAALYHISYIYAHNIQEHTDLFIEVNPRHVKFYERMLGFRQHGEEKTCPRVNAPAVLLWLELDYAHRQIQKLGGRIEHVGTEKSLYPYFFSQAVEDVITERLRQLT